MNILRITVFWTFALTIIGIAASGTTAVITVGPTGNHTAIQEAIDTAIDGDEIIVSPGTYYENINFNGKNIILRSTAPENQAVVDGTIIDGSTSGPYIDRNSGSVVTFIGTENESCILTGFTIQNGTGTPDPSDSSDSYGGGIYGNRTKATIKMNIIKNNIAYEYGGAIYQCDGIIFLNEIRNNMAFGLWDGLYECSGLIYCNILVDNLGSLYRCNGIIANNTIYNGYISNCNGLIINCIIWSDSDTIVRLGGEPIYSCIKDSSGGIGNIYSDPEFVDPENGDFHLKPTSPCIDSGSVYHLSNDFLVDFDMNCRLAGSNVDMGAYEYNSSPDGDGDLLSDSGEASLGSNPIVSDSDGDGLIDGIEVLKGSSPIQFNNPENIHIPDDYNSIQKGLFYALPGAIVTVAQGTYIENIFFPGKNIVLSSIDPNNQSIVENTIIDGNSYGNVVMFSGNEDANCYLTGFSIQNGSGGFAGTVHGNGTKAGIIKNMIPINEPMIPTSYYYLSAIYDSDGLIESNNIVNHTGYTYGICYSDGNIKGNIISSFKGFGIAYCNGKIEENIVRSNGHGCDDVITGGGIFSCDGTIANNDIYDNYGYYGAGIGGSDGLICNNNIHNNTAYRNGGGLRYSHGIIINNLIHHNSSELSSGGISLCSGYIINNTVYGNTGEEDGAGLNRCQGVVANNIIWRNESSDGSPQITNSAIPIHCCIENWGGGGRSNISDNPEFIDAEGGNFHIGPNSPCKDTGFTYMLIAEYIADIDGEARVADSIVDMGCDEHGSAPDGDADLLSDADEVIHDTNDDVADTDGDGLLDGIEVMRGSNPGIFNGPTGISIPVDCTSIQEAIFLAFPHETITVQPGTYFENIHFMGKNIKLTGQSPLDESIRSATIIDGDNLDSVITLIGSENEESSISGITIQNGANENGGGILGNGAATDIRDNTIKYCSSSDDRQYSHNGGGGLFECSGTMSNNIIKNNHSESKGGGLSYCSGTIISNIIEKNHSVFRGGGISDCDGLIKDNLINSNTSDGSGGGVANSAGPIIENVITDNSVEGYGGGINLSGIIVKNYVLHNTAGRKSGGIGGGISIDGNVIAFNEAGEDCGGVGAGNLNSFSNNTIYGNIAKEKYGGAKLAFCDVINCIIWGNEAPVDSQLYIYDNEYNSTARNSAIQGWTDLSNGTINDNPLLSDPDNLSFNLLPNSPCIDTGTEVESGEDIAGNPRPYGGGYDMGALEYVSTKLWDPIYRCTPGDECISIQWTQAYDAYKPIKYNIYMSKNSHGQNYLYPVASTEGTSITVDGLDNGWRYYIVVRAENSLGQKSTNTNEIVCMPRANLLADADFNHDFEGGVSAAPDGWSASAQTYGDKTTTFFVDTAEPYEGLQCALIETSGTPGNPDDLSIASLISDHPVSLEKDHTYVVTARVRRSHSQWMRMIVFSAGFGLIYTENIDALDNGGGDTDWELQTIYLKAPADLDVFLRIDSLVDNTRTAGGDICRMWVDDIQVIDLGIENIADTFNVAAGGPQYGIRNRYFDKGTEPETIITGGTVYTSSDMPGRWNLAMARERGSNDAPGYPVWSQVTPPLPGADGPAAMIKAKAMDTTKPSWPAISPDGVRINTALHNGLRHCLSFNYGAEGTTRPLLRVFMINSDYSHYTSLFVDPSVNIPGNRMWPLNLNFLSDFDGSLIRVRFDNVTTGPAGSGPHTDETTVYLDNVIMSVVQ